MWRSKKLIIVAVVAAVILAGSIGGVVLASDTENQSGAQHEALLDRVCEIYKGNTGIAIDADELQKAYTEAQNEMQVAAMEDHLARMVENGVIDEAQAKELQEWWQSRPDDVPIAPGLGGRCILRGFGGPGGGFPRWFGSPSPE